MHMQNPWVNLRKGEPYILEIDAPWLLAYDQRLQKRMKCIADKNGQENFIHEYRLCTEDVPFPYYGNPSSARVVVLQANPGHDTVFSQRSDHQEMMELDYKNLFHIPQPGIYSMTPSYREWVYTDGTKGMCWYWKRTKQLRELVGWERVAKGMMYMEMFPYRSVKLMYPKYLPPSQEYTFFLLRQLLERNVWVIITRMENDWMTYIHELKNYPRILRLNSHQNVTLSKNNLGEEAFKNIVDAL